MFDDQASQKAMFDRVALPLVEDILFGKNGKCTFIVCWCNVNAYRLVLFYYYCCFFDNIPTDVMISLYTMLNCFSHNVMSVSIVDGLHAHNFN